MSAPAWRSWRRPRGLAPVAFALLIMEELGKNAAGPVVAAISVTVLATRKLIRAHRRHG